MKHNEKWDNPIIHLCPNYFITYFKQNGVKIPDEESFVKELLSRCSIATWEICRDIIQRQYKISSDKIIRKTTVETEENIDRVNRLISKITNPSEKWEHKKYQSLKDKSRKE